MPSTHPHEAAGATCVPGRSLLLSWTRLTPLYAPTFYRRSGSRAPSSSLRLARHPSIPTPHTGGQDLVQPPPLLDSPDPPLCPIFPYTPSTGGQDPVLWGWHHREGSDEGVTCLPDTPLMTLPQAPHSAPQPRSPGPSVCPARSQLGGSLPPATPAKKPRWGEQGDSTLRGGQRGRQCEGPRSQGLVPDPHC